MATMRRYGAEQQRDGAAWWLPNHYGAARYDDGPDGPGWLALDPNGVPVGEDVYPTLRAALAAVRGCED